jgi:menaquinone-specific isochorismate synthase
MVSSFNDEKLKISAADPLCRDSVAISQDNVNWELPNVERFLRKGKILANSDWVVVSYDLPNDFTEKKVADSSYFSRSTSQGRAGVGPLAQSYSAMPNSLDNSESRAKGPQSSSASRDSRWWVQKFWENEVFEIRRGKSAAEGRSGPTLIAESVKDLDESGVVSVRISREHFLQGLTDWMVQQKSGDANDGSRQEQKIWQEPSFENFRKAFELAQERFAKGDLKKVVPVVFAETAWTPDVFELATTLLAGVRGDAELTVYGDWNAQAGFLGATPELLARRRGNMVYTMALAGTRWRDRSSVDTEVVAAPLSIKSNQNSIRGPKAKVSRELTDALNIEPRFERAVVQPFAADVVQSFLEDTKEQAEHRWVVEDIIENLSHFGKVSVGETGIQTLPHLMHLKTEIQCELSSEDQVVVDSLNPQKSGSINSEIIRSLHPTSALGCSPRSQMRFLKELDQVTCGPGRERGRFGAPFGYIHDDQSFDIFVCIRGFEWSDGVTRLGSGCGLVAASDLETEWRELAAKRASVRRHWKL